MTARKRKKLLGKRNWFQPRKKERRRRRAKIKRKRMPQKGDEIPTISILFCLHTPGGQAEKNILKILREGIKVVERGKRMINKMDLLQESRSV